MRFLLTLFHRTPCSPGCSFAAGLTAETATSNYRVIRQLNVEGAVTGGLLNGSMTWPRPGLKLAEAFLCVRAVKKNPKRGGLGPFTLGA